MTTPSFTSPRYGLCQTFVFLLGEQRDIESHAPGQAIASRYGEADSRRHGDRPTNLPRTLAYHSVSQSASQPTTPIGQSGTQ
eukprot:14257860-Heterocapsa_arctica.AAC.1